MRRKKIDEGIPREDFRPIVEKISREKNLPKEAVVESLKTAIVEAARRLKGEGDYEVMYNEEKGEVKLYEFKEVTEKVENSGSQITLQDARRRLGEAGQEADIEVGDSIGFELSIKDILGRAGAYIARDVLARKISEEESSKIYEEFRDKKGLLVSGIVKRIDRSNIYVDLGRAEALLPPDEKIPGETIKRGDIVKAVIKSVEKTPAGTRIVLSRASEEFVKELFRNEVPEIYQNVVEIKAIAREAGLRTKMAVYSAEQDIDPVGACVGVKGVRVQNIVQELRGERIDIVPWSDDIRKFVASALSPAQVRVMVMDKARSTIVAVVSEDNLSLAIGRKGINVRLASRLTEWKIDVKSEAELAEIQKSAQEIFAEIPDIGPKTAQVIYSAGFKNIEDIASAPIETLENIPGLTKADAIRIQEAAKKAILERMREEREEGIKEEEGEEERER